LDGIGQYSELIRLTFEDKESNQYDLMKKTHQDCIKNGKNEDFSKFQKLLIYCVCLLIRVISQYCPCTQTTSGTLILHIPVPFTENNSTGQDDLRKMAPNEITTTSPVAETGAMGPNDGVESLDKLGVAPRPCLGSSISPAQLNIAPLTPTQRTSCVDLHLNPTPLPPLNDILRDLLDFLTSENCRLELLGDGQSGKVYNMMCPLWNVAVKKIDLAKTSLEKAQLEEQIMKSIVHPNIVRYIIGVLDEENDEYIIIMELMPGGSLKKKIENGGPIKDESDIIAYIRDLLRGVKHLHENSIVHSDLTADNLLLSDEGVLKICDFGHASYIIEEAVEAEYVQGTDYCMAPEYIQTRQFTQARNSKARDINNVGAVVWKMVTGKPIGTAPSVSEIPDYVSHNLRNFLMRCLEPDQSKCSSAAELLDDPLFEAISLLR
jgi:tRNA A-37 threonylcarbamoyl transferase component Bud32